MDCKCSARHAVHKLQGGIWFVAQFSGLLSPGYDKYVQLVLRREMLKYVHSVKTIRNQLRIQG
jgi:hypothetical protein